MLCWWVKQENTELNFRLINLKIKTTEPFHFLCPELLLRTLVHLNLSQNTNDSEILLGAHSS